MWKHFQPGEGPSGGPLPDCENWWIVCSSSRVPALKRKRTHDPERGKTWDNKLFMRLVISYLPPPTMRGSGWAGELLQNWAFCEAWGQVVLTLCLCGAEVNVRILYPIVLRWLHHTVATEWLQSADTHQRSYLLLFLPQTHSNVAFPPSTFGAWPRKLGIRNYSSTVFYVYRGWYLNIGTALPLYCDATSKCPKTAIEFPVHRACLENVSQKLRPVIGGVVHFNQSKIPPLSA